MKIRKVPIEIGWPPSVFLENDNLSWPSKCQGWRAYTTVALATYQYEVNIYLSRFYPVSQFTVIRVKTNISPTRNLWESTVAMASSSSCSYSSCDSGTGSVNDTSEEKTNVRLQNCKSEESIDHETCKRVEDDDQQSQKFQELDFCHTSACLVVQKRYRRS